MTNEQIINLLNQSGLEVSNVTSKSNSDTQPTQDILEQLSIEKGLTLQSSVSKSKKTWLGRKTKANAKFNNQIVAVTFTYKRVLGSEVGDTEGAEKQRFALYIDNKFYTGVYFKQLSAVKQFEFMLKYNQELLTDEAFSAYHIGSDWKLPTQFLNDLGKNKCLAWTSSHGVPVMVPTIFQCQNYDNTNDMNGTPFSRPNKIMSKNDAGLSAIQIGQVYQSNIPVMSPDRWTSITKSMHAGTTPSVTPDEQAFIKYYMELVSKVKA